MKIGITGQNGFIGWHLYNTLGCYGDQYERIDFDRRYFEDDNQLDKFVSSCDVVVHLAAINRCDDLQLIYKTNVGLVERLVASLKRTGSKAHVLFSSSSQEYRDNLYGRSKKDGRELLAKWAAESGGTFIGLIIPNVFGPFGAPDYNSFISTFCYRLTHSEVPEINVDGSVPLIYVAELVQEIIKAINKKSNEPSRIVHHTKQAKVSQVLDKLKRYKEEYFENGKMPAFISDFDLNLFNTFRSYIDYKKYFPVKLTQAADSRGAFVEIVRTSNGGQVSFSTTFPGITRGNHYHLRKIERFAVVHGKAVIQLRKIGVEEVLSFELNGNEAGYVDIPIWYTHNITNVGNDVLYTIFWISEPYDPNDTDTYMEKV